MVFSKRLLLKVVGGGIGFIGTGGAVLYGAKNSKKNDQQKNVDVGIVVIKSKSDGAIDKERKEMEKGEIDALGIPVECKADEVNSRVNKKTCQLFDIQVEKIKFELAGDAAIDVWNLSWNKKVTLTIEYTDDTEHFPDNKKYIFTNNLLNDKDVEMRNIKGGTAILKMNGPGFAFRKNSDGKLEKAPFEDKFGIPLSCQSYKVKAGKSQTCQLTLEQLKKVKFEPNTSGGSITINGLSGNNKVDLTISHEKNDTVNYPKNKKYSFTNKNNDPITIKGTKEEDIILEKGKEVTFREKEGNVLERVIEIDKLGIPRVCTKSECDLTEKDLKKIKFDGFKDNQTTTVDGLEGGKKIKLKVEKVSGKNEYIFKGTDKNVKLTNGTTNVEFKVGHYSYFKEEKGKLKKEKEIDEFGLLGIPSSCEFIGGSKKECEINVSDLKNFKFSIKGNKEELTVTPTSSSNKIKLKIESVTGEKEYTDGIRYILKDIKENITISGEIEENKMAFNKERDDEIWFRKNEKGELEKVRTVPKVDDFGIPSFCGFSIDENSPLECELEVHYLEKIKFKFFKEGSGNIKSVVTGGSPKIKLKRSKVDSGTNEDSDQPVFDKDLIKHTFEIRDGSLKIVKGEKEMHFKKGTDPEFKKDKTTKTLERVWDANKLGNKIGLSCEENGMQCTTHQATIGVLYGEVAYEAGMQKAPAGSKKIKYFKDQEGYNQGFKFVPEEEITLKSSGKADKNINKWDSFEIKYHFLNNKWYLTKVSPK